MNDYKLLVSLLVLLAISVFFMFAQETEHKPKLPQTQTSPAQSPKITVENANLEYAFTKGKPIDYLFTSHTEANVFVKNLADSSKDKRETYILTADTLLRFYTVEELGAGAKLEISIREIAGSLRHGGKNLEFRITPNGMQTNIDGKQDEEIKELDFWESGSWRSKAPESLNKPLAGFVISNTGRISRAYTLTGTGKTGKKGAKKSLNFLQNPLILANLIFFQLPEKTLNFRQKNGFPLAPKPVWKGTINFPFKSPFEFEPVNVIFELNKVGGYTVSKKTKTKGREKNKNKKADTKSAGEFVKVFSINCKIKHKDYKNWRILAIFEFDTKHKLPKTVYYNIEREITQKPAKNREIKILQNTEYKFVLQNAR